MQIEDTPESLSAQITELQIKHDALMLKRCDSRSIPEYNAMSEFDSFVRHSPLEYIRLDRESKRITITDFKKIPNEQLERCLRFFSGKSQNIKKEKLIKLLEKVTLLRTRDIKRLELHLYNMKEWMREHNITCPLEELPHLVK